MAEKHYEMQWDCQFCGSTKLLGKTHRFCPNCGAPQNPDARYFPSDDEKVAVEDHVFVGRDRICPSCGELNSGDAHFCQQCGAPLDEAEEARTVGEQSRGAGEKFEAMASRDVAKERFESEMERVGASPKKKKQKKPRNMRWLVLLAVLGVVVCGGIFFLLNWTEEATVSVVGHTWERTISIEEYRNFTTQNWHDARPAGDNVTRGSCTQRQRSTRQVPDGQDCRTVRVDRGDGTFTERQECQTRYRSEPVYDQWCTWRGQRWEGAYTVTSDGASLSDTPYWEDVGLQCEGQRRVGCERIGGRNEVYNVLLQGEQTLYTCAYAQDAWASYALESEWLIDIRVIDNNAADCGSIRPSS